MMKSRRYSELIRLPSFKERYDYLKLKAFITCFENIQDRQLNQAFYRSIIWKQQRDKVILRDNGNDLGVEGHVIMDKILIHHIIPITSEDIENENTLVLDMDNLISTSLDTHNAIHYDNEFLLPRKSVERTPNDTTLWKGGTLWAAYPKMLKSY